MNRFLTTFSVAALALAVPVLTLAAPVGGLPAYHPLLRPSGSTGISSPRVGRAPQEEFKLPFDFHMHPQSQGVEPTTTWNSLRWHGWQPVPGSLLYQPLWYQAGCYAGGGLAGTAASVSTPIGTSKAASNFTIGSLADGSSSELFGSSASDVARLASAGSGAATSSPLTLQYGVVTTPCGGMNPLGF